MYYAWTAIPDSAIPRAAHLSSNTCSIHTSVRRNRSLYLEGIRTPTSPTNHMQGLRTWDIFRHQLLSERRFFGEFLHTRACTRQVFPASITVESAVNRYLELAQGRLELLPNNKSRGGWRWCRSSTWSASASGSSGGALLHTRIIALNSLSISRCLIGRCRPLTVPRRISPGLAPIRRTR